MRDLAGQALRFGTVGVLQNGANVAAFAGLEAAEVPYLICSLLAGAVGLTIAFLLNRSWTFRSEDPGHLAQGARYALVHVAAVGLGLLLLIVLVEGAGVGPVTGQVVAVLIVAPISFAVQRFWTFAGSRGSGRPGGGAWSGR